MMKKAPHALITIMILGIIFVPNFLLQKIVNRAIGQSYDQNDEVKQLNSQIQSKKNSLKSLQDKQAAYSRAIAEKQQEKASLNNQLSILDNRVAKSELDIETTETEIERANLEIRKTDVEIMEKNEEIENEKIQIATALKLIYKQDRASTLEILLLNNSFSEFLNQAKYLEDVNNEIGKSLENLKRLRDDLEAEKTALGEKNKELAKLKSELEEQKKSLEDEKGNKFYLLEQTNLSEREYQRLLARARQEQLQAANDIAGLERSVREKMAQMSNRKLEFNDNGLIWPVPKNTITAYFHDPDYPFKYIFEHPAIDVRAGQGTTLRAAASGYVARAKNAGMGYNYIMLVHGDGISTVYGHVSKIYVKEDEYVTQGQAIGLSGGLPGTPGAGPLTTGPHLHFEVRSNGLPVDPLDYLP